LRLAGRKSTNVAIFQCIGLVHEIAQQQNRKWESKIAAYEPGVLTSQLVEKLERNFNFFIVFRATPFNERMLYDQTVQTGSRKATV